MQSWIRFRRLSAGERRIVIVAATALVATQIALRLIGFRLWRRGLAVTFPAAESSQSSMVESALAIVRFEAAAARHLLFRPSCLERALVLWWMLRRRGLPAALQIGAKKEGGLFEAHAWVELGGVAVNDPAGTRLDFTRFGTPISSIKVEAKAP